MAYLQQKIGLHPLAEPQFERMKSINQPSLRSLKAPVVWNEDVYALGRDSNDDGKLFKYSVMNNDWSEISVPSSVYASNSVLTTYHSKLLLIRGKDMTIWEFSVNDLSFKQSNIETVPNTLSWNDYDDFIAISKDECLIVCMKRKVYCPGFVHMIYNGQNWKFSKYESIEKFGFHSTYRHEVLIDNHDIIIIASSDWGNEVRVLKAPVWSRSFDEIDDESILPVNWEELAVTSFAEFNTLICQGSYSTILHNQQVYFVDPRGVIITSFVQPPIVPVVWGSSGVNFQHAPRLVGLPNGNMLMIGMIGHGHQHGSQLDVIKVSQKDHEYNPDSHVTMKALATLEWGMNIPVLTKLQSNLSDFKEQTKRVDISTKPLRETREPHWLQWCRDDVEFRKLYKTGSTSSEVIEYTERWINSTNYKCVPEPTWRNFFKILKDASPELGQLAYQIKETFNATKAAEDAVKLKAHLIHLQGSFVPRPIRSFSIPSFFKMRTWGRGLLQDSSKTAEEIERELESCVALCDDILQKAQKADEEREQLAMQLQVQAKELIELNEQLKLLKQAEDDNKARKLTNKDLPLLRQLKIHAAKWREIGIHLGFLTGELASIEARPNLSHSAPLSWFVSMLEDWLQWAPEDSRGSISYATLEGLMDALRQSGLGASACDLKLKVTM